MGVDKRSPASNAPRPFGLRVKSRQAALRGLQREGHLRRPAPCLTGFDPATRLATKRQQTLGEVSDFLLNEALQVADFLCPNQLELDSFCGRKPQSLLDCVAMARSVLARGPQAVLVKHLDYPGKLADGFEMLLVTAQGSWHLRRPLLAFPRQ